MGKTTRRWQFLVGIIGLLFLATACFQQVGDEAQGQAVSVRSTDTSTPEPTFTPIPPSETPTEMPTEVEAQDVSISDNATATEEPTATNTPMEVAQGDDGAQDPFEITATALVEQATQRALQLTDQWLASQGIGVNTETPTPTMTQFGVVQQQPVNIVPGTDCIYEVRAGDTLWNISRRFGITVMDIVSANGISNFNLIVVGDRLTISQCGTTGYIPPATSTPIPSLTPYGFGVTQDASTAGIVATPVVCQSQYTIQEKDTLFNISIRYGVTVQALMNANPDIIFDPSRITMGDIICIPSA